MLKIGLPLVVSMGSATVMQFTDRIFLSNYSLESIAAATPAGILSFLFTCFFLGVVTYGNVFVASTPGLEGRSGWPPPYGKASISAWAPA